MLTHGGADRGNHRQLDSYQRSVQRNQVWEYGKRIDKLMEVVRMLSVHVDLLLHPLKPCFLFPILGPQVRRQVWTVCPGPFALIETPLCYLQLARVLMASYSKEV